jgi:cytochrome P450
LQAIRYVVGSDRFVDACMARYGPTFTLRLPRSKRLVMIADPAVAADVFKAHAAIVTGAPRAVGSGGYGFEGLLLAAHGPDHQRRRRDVTLGLRGQQLQAHRETISQVVEDAVQSWPTGSPIALFPLLSRLTLNVTLLTILGIEDAARREQVAALVLAARSLYRNRWSRVLASLAFRRLGTVRVNPTPHAALALAIKQEVRRRRAESPPRTGGDALSLQLRSGGDGLGDDEIVNRLMPLVMLGWETTACGAAWTFERLLRHPASLARVAAVARAGELDPYIEAVVREALRLHPPVPRLYRRLPVQAEFGPFSAPAGASLVVLIDKLQRRADLHPDPDRFRPERFLATSLPTHGWMTFGEGARRCVGAGLAMLEIKEIVRVLVRQREMLAVDEADEPPRQVGHLAVPGFGARARMEPVAT